MIDRKAKSPSLFANPACITAWRAEAKRAAINTDDQRQKNAQHVQEALELLDELYCLNNPQNKNPLFVRQAAFAQFLEASMAGYPLGMFFEGLARKEGFGCNKDQVAGQALIQVAGTRKCAEALNYLAVCSVRQDLLLTINLLREAAQSGHSQATSNLRQLMEEIRIQIRRKRKFISFTSQTHSLRPSM